MSGDALIALLAISLTQDLANEWEWALSTMFTYMSTSLPTHPYYIHSQLKVVLPLQLVG